MPEDKTTLKHFSKKIKEYLTVLDEHIDNFENKNSKDIISNMLYRTGFDCLMLQYDFLANKGIPRAIESIFKIASTGSHKLWKLECSQKSMLVEIAKTEEHWPINISNRIHTQDPTTFVDDLQNRFENIQLGINLPYPKNKQAQENLKTAILAELEQTVANAKRGLIETQKGHWTHDAIQYPDKPLKTKGNAENRFKLLWEILLSHNDGHPELNPRIKKIGQSEETKTLREIKEQKNTAKSLLHKYAAADVSFEIPNELLDFDKKSYDSNTEWIGENLDIPDFKKLEKVAETIEKLSAPENINKNIQQAIKDRLKDHYKRNFLIINKS